LTEWKINSYASTEDETFTKEYKDLTEDEKTQLLKNMCPTHLVLWAVNSMKLKEDLLQYGLNSA
jgi:hypothetical protein